MKSRSIGYYIILFAFLFSFAQAREIPRFPRVGNIIHGGSVDLAKAGADTINLMATHRDRTNEAGEPTYYGDFEDAEGNPDWNGWTHYDVTQVTVSHWNVSNYNQPDPANHAAWCGDINIPSCNFDDPEGGYGNSWNELLEFRLTVPNPGSSTTVTVTATLIHDTEPTYDFTYLSYRYHGQLIADLQSWDDMGTVAVQGSVTYLPEEYLDGTDIAVYFRFKSDGAWSDEDCNFTSAGACQIDDINVQVVNGSYIEDFFEDFEHGAVPEDFGLWNIAYPQGVGDFAKIWENLRDVDPCINNFSPQVAFIDDGLVVPGTGGSRCINWCYGPGGYIVNTTGGVAGPEHHIHNAIESPVMAWPPPKSGSGPDDEGISFAFGVYRHEDLSADSPGIWFDWGIRSADTDGSAGAVQILTEQGYLDRTLGYVGGPDYWRFEDDVTDLMNPGRDEIQIRLEIFELGWQWNGNGNDGTPAPYFDNITVKVFPHRGPGMIARGIDLAQDNFPQRGSIDFEDLGSHSVRFDMAKNISQASHMRNDPGDSLVMHIAPVRAGADLDGPIKLQYLLNPNPVFTAAMRTAGLPERGFVEAMPAVGAGGQVQTDSWAFDLPDTGFLFPGDELHYYIEATDAIGGTGGTDPRTALMPADTTGFSTEFRNPLGYDSAFTVHALPTIRDDDFGGYLQPEVLFINDNGIRGGENEWYMGLHHLGLISGDNFDIYHVNSPSSGVGNGIGGRAGAQTLSGYTEILYTCGNLGINTISNGDFNNDAGDDVRTLTGWFEQGGKDMFLTGDDLASDMAQAGAATLDFLGDKMGVSVLTSNIRPSIGNQTTPLVQIIPFNPVFHQSGSLQNWFAFGACPRRNTFDGVDLFGAGQRLAEFTDPLGSGYGYSACTLNIWNPGPNQSRVISMPVDLMYVYTNPDGPAYPLPARVQLLRDVLQYFGIYGEGEPSGIGELPGITFAAANYPNPFNPSTTIKYSLPKAGHLRLNIYNVRGQLVKTLINGPRPAGANQAIVWDGTDNLGSAAASGVYFYEARALGDVRIGKATLLK